MNRDTLTKSAVLGLFLSYGVLMAVKVQAQETSSPRYTFKCVSQQKGVFATTTVRPDGVTINPSLIVWKSQEFSTKGYTPKRRCEVVTDKLNTILSKAGGNPDSIRLTMGLINNLPVLCYADASKSSCDNNNVVVTLSKKNRDNSSRIMAGMLQFLVAGRGSAIVD